MMKKTDQEAAPSGYTNRQKRRATRLALRRLLGERERPTYPLPEPPVFKPLG